MIVQHETESLPYIDAPPSPTSLSRAETLIAAANPHAFTDTLHPNVPLIPQPSFPSLFQHEIDRLAAIPDSDREQAKMQGGIDASRYAQIPDLPAPPYIKSAKKKNTGQPMDLTAETTSTISSLYTTRAYLGLRQTQLDALSDYGKNAWLIGNDVAEQNLLLLEKQLAHSKDQVEQINQARKASQLAAHPALEAREEAWRSAIGKKVEIDLALRTMR